MTEMQQVADRIKKFKPMTDEQTERLGEVDPDGKIEETIRQDAVTDILVELLECLKCGETLEDAIATIHANF